MTSTDMKGRAGSTLLVKATNDGVGGTLLEVLAARGLDLAVGTEMADVNCRAVVAPNTFNGRLEC